MASQPFRLGSVLKHYVLKKQKAEMDLQQSLRALGDLDREVEKITTELSALGEYLNGKAAGSITVAGWTACGLRSVFLHQNLETARARRLRQAEVVARCAEVRKQWAVAEESLLLLRGKIEAENREAAAHADQLQLQEIILRLSLPVEDDASK